MNSFLQLYLCLFHLWVSKECLLRLRLRLLLLINLSLSLSLCVCVCVCVCVCHLPSPCLSFFKSLLTRVKLCMSLFLKLFFKKSKDDFSHGFGSKNKKDKDGQRRQNDSQKVKSVLIWCINKYLFNYNYEEQRKQTTKSIVASSLCVLLLRARTQGKSKKKGNRAITSTTSKWYKYRYSVLIQRRRLHVMISGLSWTN